jgi:hypothetical protein
LVKTLETLTQQRCTEMHLHQLGRTKSGMKMFQIEDEDVFQVKIKTLGWITLHKQFVLQQFSLTLSHNLPIS